MLLKAGFLASNHHSLTHPDIVSGILVENSLFSQWRDRVGIAPTSLLILRRGTLTFIHY